MIDLGPEGGAGGGTIVATGTPEQVAKVEGSHTGAFLAELLETGRTGTPRNAPPLDADDAERELVSAAG